MKSLLISFCRDFFYCPQEVKPANLVPSWKRIGDLMNFFQSMCRRISNMLNLCGSEKKTFSNDIYCIKNNKFIREGDCLSSILSVKDKNDLSKCREECSFGKKLRASCPFDKRWRAEEQKNSSDIQETITPVKEEPAKKVSENKCEMSIGQRLKAAREALGLTQEQLAEKSEFSVRSLSRWEKDKSTVSIGKRKALIKALNLPDDFFD